MERSLQHICVQNISININLNYQLCQKFKYKIPSKIGNLIFKHLLNNNSTIDDNIAKIFEKKITNLSEIYIGKKSININCFNFLNDHHLELLHFKIFENLKLESSSFRIFTKKMILEDMTESSFSSEETMKNFFKNSLRVSETIILKENVFTYDIHPISFLIRNSLESLNCLEISGCKFTQENLTNLLSEIFKLKHLEELIFNSFSYIKLNKPGIKMNLTNEHKEFGKKLKKLTIPSFFYLINEFMFENLQNLYILEIFDGIKGEPDYGGKIFEFLSNRDMSSLKEITLEISECSCLVHRSLLKFLKNLKNLNKVIFNGIFINEWHVTKVLACLKSSRGSLQKFSSSSIFKIHASKVFLEFYESCKALNSFNISSSDNHLDLSIKIMNNCKDTLEELIFSERICNKVYFQSEIPKLKNLKRLKVKERWETDLYDFLELFVQNNQQIAIELEITTTPKTKREYELLELIAKRYNLQSLELQFQKKFSILKEVFTDSFFRHNQLQELNLMYMDIYENNLEYLLQLFTNLKHLKKVKISSIHVQESNFDKFLHQLNCINVKVETFIFRYKFTNYSECNIERIITHTWF